MTDKELMQQWLDAIAAIPEDVEGYLPDALTDVLIATRERLAQPEQEPVAHSIVAGALFDFMGWLTSRDDRLVLSSTDDAGPAADAIKDFAQMRSLSIKDAQVQEWQDHLATPQPRQWVGLTDEDRVELWADSANIAGFGGMKFEHIRAVEAKLKEKNT